VALVAVALEKDPQAAPLQAGPEICQVTPWLVESLLTVAIKLAVSPASRVVWADGDKLTVMACGVGLPLGLIPPPPPPHPQINIAVDRTTDKDNADLLTLSSPEYAFTLVLNAHQSASERKGPSLPSVLGFLL